MSDDYGTYVDDFDALERSLPRTPYVDDRELALAALHPNKNGRPLSDEEQAEFDRLIGLATHNMRPHGPVYNQAVTMLTVAEVAEQLGISVSTARRRINTGKIPSFRMFGTIRVRSDLVWAAKHWPDLDLSGREGLKALRRTHQVDTLYRGVRLDDVAATLRVSPRTVRECSARTANFIEASFREPWPIAGHGAGTMVLCAPLERKDIPFRDDQVHATPDLETRGLDRKTKRAMAEALRRVRSTIPPEQVRRCDRILDSASGQPTMTYRDIARELQMSVSGARKAVQRAGIAVQHIGGVDRVRRDDVTTLQDSRAGREWLRANPNHSKPLYRTKALVSLATAASRMGISERTLRRWIAAGRIPGVIRDGALWVRSADLEAFLRSPNSPRARARARTEARTAGLRGAALTEGHMQTYTTWLRWKYPDIDIDTGFRDRRSAAEHAGCRPSVIEELVAEGLIPAQRCGRDLRIRFVDLVAAGVFSAKVARMCPGLRTRDRGHRRMVKDEFLNFEKAAAVLKRPVSEVRWLARQKILQTVRFGTAHRVHVSEVFGPGSRRLYEAMPAYTPLTYNRESADLTINEAANELCVSERTVLRWIHQGALVGTYATTDKMRFSREFNIWRKVPRRVNRGGALVLSRSVDAARQLRQAYGFVALDAVRVSVSRVRKGDLPKLQAWQEFVLVD